MTAGARLLAALLLLAPGAEKSPESLDTALARGAYTEVEARCRARLSEAPEDAAAAAGLVRALLGRDAWQEALRTSGAYGGEAPAPVLRAARGEALYRAGFLEEAEAALLPLSEPEPPPRALLTLGLLRVAQGREDEGARTLDAALERAPDDPDVVFAAAEAAPTRARAAELLARYLALPRAGEDARREAAQASLRLQRALGERQTWIPSRRPPRVEIPLRRLPGGAGRARGYVLDADLGGKKRVPLLLDTGSGGLFLVARAVRKQAVLLSEDTVFAGGGSGRQSTRRALLPTLALPGGLAWSDALVTLGERDLEPTGRFLGVLGLSVFQGYRITLDLAAPRIVLESGPGFPGGEPYWTVQGQWLVRAAASGKPGLYLLDTGATASAVSWEVAGEDVRQGPGPRREGYSGTIAARWARGIELSFGGRSTGMRPLAAVDLAQRSRLGGVEVSGHLGLDLLDGSTLVIDTVAHRLRAGSP